jgi:hypothetical protein
LLSCAIEVEIKTANTAKRTKNSERFFMTNLLYIIVILLWDRDLILTIAGKLGLNTLP